ncbi:microneme protein mic1 [Cystoisospora suis]|uniref:Microneme protein mic1 n=1 Tax=Cystoisospora suis TaxID=483139 RepID=A0A2C6KIJ9_9APIC|nr:microneme protein mic1 [Cystoisospora suis]
MAPQLNAVSTVRSLQSHLDARCQDLFKTICKTENRDEFCRPGGRVVFRHGRGGHSQPGNSWRCYDSSRLLATGGGDNGLSCVDNCGHLIPCPGSVDPATTRHASREEMADWVLGSVEKFCSSFQAAADLYCYQQYEGTIARFSKGYGSDPEAWRCYVPKSLSFALLGQCVDNCGGNTSCSGGRPGTTTENDKLHYTLSEGILDAIKSVQSPCKEEEVCMPKFENPPLCVKSVNTLNERKASPSAGDGRQDLEGVKPDTVDPSTGMGSEIMPQESGDYAKPEKEDAVAEKVEQEDRGESKLDEAVSSRKDGAGSDDSVDDDGDDEERRLDDEETLRDSEDDVTTVHTVAPRSPHRSRRSTPGDVFSRHPWEETDDVSGKLPSSDTVGERIGRPGDRLGPENLYPWQEHADGDGNGSLHSEPVTAYLRFTSGEEVTVEFDSDRVSGEIGNCHSFEVNTHDQLLRYHSDTGEEVSEVNLEDATGHVKLTVRHTGSYIMVGLQYSVQNGSRSLFYVAPDSRCNQAEELVFRDLAVGASLTRSAATRRSSSITGSGDHSPRERQAR